MQISANTATTNQLFISLSGEKLSEAHMVLLRTKLIPNNRFPKKITSIAAFPVFAFIAKAGLSFKNLFFKSGVSVALTREWGTLTRVWAANIRVWLTEIRVSVTKIRVWGTLTWKCVTLTRVSVTNIRVWVTKIRVSVTKIRMWGTLTRVWATVFSQKAPNSLNFHCEGGATEAIPCYETALILFNF